MLFHWTGNMGYTYKGIGWWIWRRGSDWASASRCGQISDIVGLGVHLTVSTNNTVLHCHFNFGFRIFRFLVFLLFCWSEVCGLWEFICKYQGGSFALYILTVACIFAFLLAFVFLVYCQLFEFQFSYFFQRLYFWCIVSKVSGERGLTSVGSATW